MLISKTKNFLGFSLVVNPELLTARYIANTVEFPNALSVETFANGRVILMAFKVTENSQLSGMTMEQFRRNSAIFSVCTIHRQGELIIQTGMLPCKLGIRFMSLVNVLIWHFSQLHQAKKHQKTFVDWCWAHLLLLAQYLEKQSY